jgi:hypothetical protein
MAHARWITCLASGCRLQLVPITLYDAPPHCYKTRLESCRPGGGRTAGKADDDTEGLYAVFSPQPLLGLFVPRSILSRSLKVEHLLDPHKAQYELEAPDASALALALVQGPPAFSSASKAVHDALFRLDGFDGPLST